MTDSAQENIPKKIRVAINGFGRIGRASLKILLDNESAEVVAINDLGHPRMLAHLLKYDSAYGIYERTVSVEETGKTVVTEGDETPDDHFAEEIAPDIKIVIDGIKIPVFAQKDPEQLPWKDLEVDVVLECTGRFTKNGSAIAHINAGAQKVIVSAPVKGEGGVQTFIKGVNDDQYIGQNIISNASCTTNSVAPTVAVMHENFKVLKSVMTTIHAVTAEQNVVDGAPPGLHADLRRARASGFNIIPTTSGAAIATTLSLPELKNKFDGIAVRVPVLIGSVSDITMVVEKKTSVEEVNAAFVAAAKSAKYKGVLEATSEPLVSSDIIKNPHSAIIDMSMTKVVDGDLVKVLAWYDNEWGYSSRLVEMALLTSL